MAAGYTKQAIMTEIKSLCERINIDVKRDFVTVTKPYRLRVEFLNEQHFTIFALQWSAKNEYFKYTVKHDDINSDIVQPTVLKRV